MAGVIGVLFAGFVFFSLAVVVNERATLAFQRFPMFRRHHPLKLLLISAFIALLGLATFLVSEEAATALLYASLVSSVVIVLLFFFFALLGFFMDRPATEPAESQPKGQTDKDSRQLPS